MTSLLRSSKFLMRIFTGFFVISAAFLLFLSSCQQSDVDPGGSTTGNTNTGNNNTGNDNTGNNNSGNNTDDEKAAPDFTLESISGNQVKLSDYKNKVVVLFFLGNTCPSCQASAPSIEDKLHAPYTSNGSYAILGLDQWDGNKASLEGFKTTTGVGFPLLLKASGVAADYGTTYDRLVVVDKDGNIAFKGTKSAGSDLSAVKDLVDSLL